MPEFRLLKILALLLLLFCPFCAGKGAFMISRYYYEYHIEYELPEEDFGRSTIIHAKDLAQVLRVLAFEHKIEPEKITITSAMKWALELN